MINLMHIAGLFLQSDSDRRFLFADEKINTVIVVVLAVFFGIVVYLILTGRKVRKIENELRELRKAKKPESGVENLNNSIEIERKKR